MKKNIRDIKEIEFKCKKCDTKVTFSINSNSHKTLNVCPVCNAYFTGKDIVEQMRILLFSLEHSEALEVSFICDDEDNNDK